MATLAAIFDAMADQIRSGVTAAAPDVDWQIEPRMVINPSPPCVDMYPADPSNDSTLAAFSEEIGGEVINVRMRVDTADSVAGQDLLLAMMDDEDPASVILALLDDRTLGGLTDDIHVPSRGGFSLFPTTQGDGALLGCLLHVVLVKARS